MVDHLNRQALGNCFVRHDNLYSSYLFLHKLDHSFNALCMTIGITRSQCYIIRFIFEFGFNRIKCFVSTYTNNIKDPLGLVFVDHKKDGMKKFS